MRKRPTYTYLVEQKEVFARTYDAVEVHDPNRIELSVSGVSFYDEDDTLMASFNDVLRITRTQEKQYRAASFR